MWRVSPPLVMLMESRFPPSYEPNGLRPRSSIGKSWAARREGSVKKPKKQPRIANVSSERRMLVAPQQIEFGRTQPDIEIDGTDSHPAERDPLLVERHRERDQDTADILEIGEFDGCVPPGVHVGCIRNSILNPKRKASAC